MRPPTPEACAQCGSIMVRQRAANPFHLAVHGAFGLCRACYQRHAGTARAKWAKPGAWKDQPWAEDGVCRTTAPDLFFPDKAQTRARKAAKAVCKTCPVVAKCLAWSIEVREPHGVLGGLDEWERAALLDRRAG